MRASSSMRTMDLPAVGAPSDHEDAVGRFRVRLTLALSVPIGLSRSLVAYMAWPELEHERKSWMASIDGRRFAQKTASMRNSSDTVAGIEFLTKEALGSVSDRLVRNSKKWAPVADVLQTVVDLQHSDLPLAGGASVSKAVEICADEKSTKSVGDMHRQWGSFRNVAHLIAAGALLAREVPESNGSIFAAAWFAPDSVLAIAAGFESFGLGFRPHGQSDSLLPTDGTWRVPRHCVPDKPWLRYRVFSERQRQTAAGYKAKKVYDRKL